MFVFFVFMIVHGDDRDRYGYRDCMGMGQAMAMMAVTVAGMGDASAQGKCPQGSGDDKLSDWRQDKSPTIILAPEL